MEEEATVCDIDGDVRWAAGTHASTFRLKEKAGLEANPGEDKVTPKSVGVKGL